VYLGTVGRGEREKTPMSSKIMAYGVKRGDHEAQIHALPERFARAYLAAVKDMLLICYHG
jgi:hypothetical protein